MLRQLGSVFDLYITVKYIMFSIVLLLAGAADGDAQEVVKAGISVPPVLFLRPGADNKIPMTIVPARAATSTNFVVIGGLPPSINVSKGYVVAPGLWSLPGDGLAGLAFSVTDGKLGRWDVVVKLVDGDNAVVAEAKTVVVIVPPGETKVQRERDETAVEGAAVAKEAPPAAVPLSAGERSRALELYNSGLEQLKNGNIYAARKFFERGAQIGLPEAALALGDTFEADMLAKLNVVGIKPDPDTARQWYERARDLRARQADERLKKAD